jgi:hypothetical protein
VAVRVAQMWSRWVLAWHVAQAVHHRPAGLAPILSTACQGPVYLCCPDVADVLALGLVTQVSRNCFMQEGFGCLVLFAAAVVYLAC